VQLVQLFQNLMSNAIKYRISEKPPQIHIFTEKLEQDWVISVRDNGMGVHSDHAAGAAVIDLGCGPGFPITEVLVAESLSTFGVDAAPSFVQAFAVVDTDATVKPLYGPVRAIASPPQSRGCLLRVRAEKRLLGPLTKLRPGI
jgi:2-polyprenyl-3-methyl-5-hydroxy-6-metoxy-1,4-benzoquinol methylase